MITISIALMSKTLNVTINRVLLTCDNVTLRLILENVTFDDTLNMIKGMITLSKKQLTYKIINRFVEK